MNMHALSCFAAVKAVETCTLIERTLN